MFYHSLIGKGETPTEDLSPVLLWENPNITGAFAAQTVNLDLTEYAGVIIEFNQGHISDNMRLGSRSYFKKTDIFSNGIGVGWIGSSGTAYARNIVKVDNTGVQFGDGSSTNYNIPIAIYGVKNYIVEPAVGDLLWHNDNPTAALNSTNVAGNYSKYSKLYVEAKMSATSDYKISAIVEKDSTYGGGLACNPANGTSLQFRTINFTDTNIHIAIGYLYTISGSTAQNGNMCVVTDIYGVE